MQSLYTTKQSNSVAIEKQQLTLFNDADIYMRELKYSRRKKRTIKGKTFDILPPSDKVSEGMKKNLSKNTKIEQLFEEELQKANLNYCTSELLIEEVEGKPDFLLPRYKIAIFCDGDFWHGKNFEPERIKNNKEFWEAKIEANILRDEEVNYGLKKKEWTVFRFWESEIKKNVSGCINLILNHIKTHFPDPKFQFTFVDLFAGIGGFRIPLEELGGKCLGFSEIDKAAIEVYKRNFFGFKNEEEIELGDITKLSQLPFKNIDLIVGGVPCQAWSVAGKMKAFDDPRGKLWHNTIQLIKVNQPKAFILENVKGLIDPRNKKNLQVILSNLKKAGYAIKEPRLLNSYDFGLPQNRDRIFIVGIRNDLSCFLDKFEYPAPVRHHSILNNILFGFTSGEIDKKQFSPKEIFGEKIPLARNRFQKLHELNDFFIFCDTRNGHTTIHSWDIKKTTSREKEICLTIMRNRRKKIYGDSDGNPLSFHQLKLLIGDLKEQELETLIQKKILRKHGDKYEFVNSKNSAGINGVYRVYLPHSKVFSTLTATGTKDYISLDMVYGDTPAEYRENFISEIVKKRRFRPISAKEAGKLQGFPDWFAIHPKSSQAMKQFGNAVSTNVILHLAKHLLKTNIFNESK